MSNLQYETFLHNHAGPHSTCNGLFCVLLLLFSGSFTRCPYFVHPSIRCVFTAVNRDGLKSVGRRKRSRLSDLLAKPVGSLGVQSRPAKQAMIQAEHKIKLVLLGEVSVGKTSVVEKYVKNEYVDIHQPTIGAAYLSKTMELDNQKIYLDIWDTAGQEKYKALAPLYYRGTAAAIVVYEITSKATFEAAKKWVVNLEENADEGIEVVLCGNKIDLERHREVTTEEAQEYAKSKGLSHAECSAKTGVGVEEMFQQLCRGLLEKRSGQQKGKVAGMPELTAVDLQAAASGPPQTGGCCK